MRIERHDRRPQPGPPRRVDHPQVPAVHAVERPDRDRTPRLRQSGGSRATSRAHPGRAASTRASTSASASSRSAVNASGAPRRRPRTARPPFAAASRSARRARRERPDVRPGADADIERDALARIRDDVERVAPSSDARHLHLDAAPREPVRALTADLHRGRGGDRQLDLAAEAPRAVRPARLARRLLASTTSPSGSPVEVRAGEIDLGDVALVQADEARGELSCPSGQQQQEPRRERIERSGVTGPRTRQRADLRDDRERRWAARLVDERDARGLKRCAVARCARKSLRGSAR